MVLIQKIDRQKFTKKPILYTGNGFISLNNHPIYLHQKGGFISSLLPLIDKGVDFVSNNKDLISQTGLTVSSVANAVKAVSDTIKKSKEIENEIQQRQRQRSNYKKKDDVEFSPEQLVSLKLLAERQKQGSGFVKF
jgi:hypothetical protein